MKTAIIKTASATLSQKKAQYSCGTAFKTLADIPTWPAYAKENSYYLQKVALAEPPKFSVAADLNDRVSVFRGDITTLEVGAIVNAANASLMGGGGVDGAIHRAAGRELKAECATLNGCATGDAKMTGGHRLPAERVLHTVGPIGEHADKLESCYATCLGLARDAGARSIAFPCISTGVYGYPNKKAAVVAVATVRGFLDRHPDAFDRVIFCLFLSVDVEIYSQLLPIYFPLGDGEEVKKD
ncbi:PREDICTED: macro domain-containing protein mll7730-like [Priapulus caudatus]|uniref:Macro domain-containing protein mll7730-like n=1 Tax=Priapulus caudatus TaxID=37621 RepID=A0ABM1ETQ7_PRICU|nr:PREDICTED: macro domain-containing protein mll7730-like [Priapulus caudatus]XP_014675578.1 PREDICTED: macro domain-containing protein mll7730-like [Priapulus caudatus]